jgi:hypothetical protein
MELHGTSKIVKVDDSIGKYFNEILIERDKISGTDMYYEFEILRNIKFELYRKYKTAYENLTSDHPKKNRFLFHDETQSMLYLISQFPYKDVEDLNDEEKWFYSLCTKDEIERIFHPKDAKDYLLKLRSAQVRDNIRLFRVFISLKEKKGNEWSFERYFDTDYFEDYLSWLPLNLRSKCEKLNYGSIELTTARAVCMPSPFGNLVVVSYALKYYLFYMNSFINGRFLDIDSDVRFRSLILAIRILMGSESIDFLVDDRGSFGEKVDKILDDYVIWQLLFIAGHEFAHHYLGHVGKGGLSEVKLFNDNKSDRIYNYSQLHEFEADRNSILSVDSEIEYCKSELTDAAILFFAGLEMFECVKNYFSPTVRSQETHPSAWERLASIWDNCKEHSRYSEFEIESMLKFLTSAKEELVREYLPFHPESFETYGSVYLIDDIRENSLDRFSFD